MSMIVGIDLQADLKKSKTRPLASSRFTKFGGTFTPLNVNAMFPIETQHSNLCGMDFRIKSKQLQAEN
ncbi:hypothetical protein SLEP1_g54806 [Rubroshorea leprosula]|uniref:Uncharacterized protein n=1 Tax=Rubroshorea leprosula TaxID=152421 RepID=A0AAV5MGH3_9ROSI|nr:hypothetical protein SLEP1_g54806 [Rubroshorea leprosula]